MKRFRWLLLLVPAFFGMALLREALLEGRVFFWHDVSIAYMPLRKLAQEAVQAGRLPLWTPMLGAGFSVQAEGQASVFYPLNLIGYLGVPYYHAYSWVVWAQLALGAMGCTLLGRRLGLGWLAATFAGLAFGFSGYFVSKVMFLTVLQSAAWLPLVLLGVIAGLETGRTQWFLLGAGAFALSILGGHPQMVFLLGLAAVLVAIWVVWARGSGAWWRRPGRLVWGGLLVIGLGAAIGAAQLLPTYYLAQFVETRTATTPEYLRDLGAQPHQLAYLVHPYVFGSYGENNYWGRGHYYEVCGFAGGLTLLLGLVALVLPRVPLRHKWLWAVLAGLGVFMALADLNPLYEHLPRAPGFSFFRGPGRYLLFTTLGLALLAGGALETLARNNRRRSGREVAGWAMLALLLSGLVMGGLHLGREPIIERMTALVPPERIIPGAAPEPRLAPAQEAREKWAFLAERLSVRDEHWVAFLAGLGAVVLVGLGVAWCGLGYRPAAGLLLVALAAQLYLFGRPANPVIASSYYTELPETARLHLAGRDWGRQYTEVSLSRLSLPGTEYPGWVSGDLLPWMQDRETLRPNTAVLWGVEAAHVEYGLVHRRQKRLLEEAMKAGLAGEPGGLGDPVQVLRMLGVRTLIAPPGLHSLWTRPMIRDPQWTMYRVSAPMRQAWLPWRVVACESEEQALEVLSDPRFRPEETAAVEGLDPQLAAGLRGAHGVTRTVAAEDTQQAWKIVTPQAAFLVINLSYDPHWRATVNGEPAQLYRANYIQLGLPVRAGTSTVELTYDMPELWLGLRITRTAGIVFGALLLLTVLVELLGRARRHGK